MENRFSQFFFDKEEGRRFQQDAWGMGGVVLTALDYPSGTLLDSGLINDHTKIWLMGFFAGRVGDRGGLKNNEIQNQAQ